MNTTLVSEEIPKWSEMVGDIIRWLNTDTKIEESVNTLITNLRALLNAPSDVTVAECWMAATWLDHVDKDNRYEHLAHMARIEARKAVSELYGHSSTLGAEIRKAVKKRLDEYQSKLEATMYKNSHE